MSSRITSGITAFKAIQIARGHIDPAVAAAAADVWRQIRFDSADVDTAIGIIKSGSSTTQQKVTAVQLLGEFIKSVR